MNAVETPSHCVEALDFLHVAHPVAPVRVPGAVFPPALDDALTGLADEDVINEKVIDVPPMPIKLLVGE